MATPKHRFADLKRQHWPRQGRKQRIAEALAALEAGIVDYGLPPEIIKRLVEDVDLEYEQ